MTTEQNQLKSLFHIYTIKVSILRVSKLHTHGYLTTKHQKTLKLPTKRVSIHCE